MSYATGLRTETIEQKSKQSISKHDRGAILATHARDECATATVLTFEISRRMIATLLRRVAEYGRRDRTESVRTMQRMQTMQLTNELQSHASSFVFPSLRLLFDHIASIRRRSV